MKPVAFRWFGGIATAVALATVAPVAAPARAEQSLGYAGRPECEPFSNERPYVCDVGDPRPISVRSFQHVIAYNDALRAVVRRIGMPDWAEIQKVSTDAPWTNYEVRLYYRDYDKMFAFGRAFILGQPEIALLRYQGPIPPGKFAMLTSVGNGDVWGDALRAERAAAEAEARAERAERDAERAEGIANAASRDFKESLVKH
ncbi:MAG TPA: hypothetical protein VFD92_27400 [Candidatus Binatia bacterium]|nr:hypothetical protein [Candidatus Binatia bacterium]